MAGVPLPTIAAMTGQTANIVHGAPSGKPRNPNNRPGLDYRAQAATFQKFPRRIVDSHSHIVGAGAARVYDEARRAYGVGLTYSMTPMPFVDAVRDVLGDTIRFIAIPTWGDPDKERAWRAGFLENIELFHAKYDARMMKIWNSPSLRDRFPGASGTDLVEMDSPWRLKAAELAQSLGMSIMVHIADPDTWFKAKYADSAKYKTKREQYEGLERMLDRFTTPWIAAHMGGWPEDLNFLDGLLSRHPNLHLDTSATKWQVRELSKHPPEESRAFFTKWKGRILFGSDIVTSDDHLAPQKVNPAHPKADQADSPESAFDLYASRFWALRTLLETSFDGESPIADGDLKMVEPGKYDDASAPRLRGMGLPRNVLESLYFGAAEKFFGAV